MNVFRLRACCADVCMRNVGGCMEPARDCGSVIGAQPKVDKIMFCRTKACLP